MKRVVSVSLGSSDRDAKRDAELLGERFSLERVGTDGSLEKFAQLVRELDGKVDAIGIGGMDIHLWAGKHRYAFRDALKLAANAKVTPVVDGSGLKNTLERATVQYLIQQGIVDFKSLKTFLVCGVDRFGMAQALAEAGGKVIYGDLMFSLKIPIPIRSYRGLYTLAVLLLPIITRLPFKWVYPTGEKQRSIVPKHVKYYQWADVICGDFLYIRKHMPDSLPGKIIVTNTTTPEDVELLKQRGVKMLVTSTPSYQGRSFGTNVMEGVVVALAGARGRELTPQDYMDKVLELGWQPTIQHLAD